eukprot:TRINITY_DN1367_c0_g1_i2.p1 TRINITY_DN1367_c0_g1~~TRINITY_DN1367_c0_g1_i2.p1  ORF type:complete len:1376 (-),score=220.11 TRINITY_DN1367_c0_g1_i2:1767-5894(-)
MFASADARASDAHPHSVAARLRRSAALLSPLELRHPSLAMDDPLRALRASLPPSSHLPRVSYCVVVATAASKFAGTDRHVYVQLLGDLAQTDYVLLRSEPSPLEPESHTFPTGSIRRFSFEDIFVGNLTKISIRHDPHEESTAAWKPDRILVTDLSLHRTWTFLCPTWLTRDIGNHIELKPQPEVHAGLRASHRAARRLSFSRPRPPTPLNPVFSPPESDRDRDESGTRRVCFQLHKFTQTFSHVYLLGGAPALGEWDPNRALRMTMHTAADGTWRGEWRLELQIDDDYNPIRYTYMIVNSTSSHEQRQVFAPDHVRTLDFSSPDLVSRAAEGARIYVKDLFGNNNFGLPSSTSPASKSSSSRRTLSRLSLRSSIPEPTLVSQGPFRSSAPFRARQLSSPIDKVHRNLSSALESSTQDRIFDSSRRSRLSEDYAIPSPSRREGITPRASLDERPAYPASNRRSTEQQDHTSRLDWKQQLDASDTHLIRSTADLRRRQSEVMFLKKRNNSDLTNGTLQSPISSPKSHEDTSPVSSDSLSESEQTSGDSVVVSHKPNAPVSNARESSGEREKLLDTIQSLRKQNDMERQARQTLRKQSEEVKRSHHQITELVNTLREQLKQVRNTMNERAEEFATQQVEVVRLLMDSKEAHSAAKQKLIADRDHILERWEREFKLRRKLFNQVQELRGNIRVFCRVRPLKQPKLPAGDSASLAVDFPDADLGENGSIRLGTKTFDFDYVFQPHMSQSQVYEETSGVVASVMDGYNVCVFAYGQTGSGKTHTMNGPPEDRGVNFRALMELFQIAEGRSEHSEISISVSMLEIYNETLRDLILPDSVSNPPRLEIRRDMSADSATAVYIPKLTEVNVDTVEDVLEVMHYGASNRSKGRTNMNEHSSRSHLILKVNVVCEKLSDGFKSSGVLHLVDLAGSERVARSQATGDRLKEAQHINKSLATLGDVFTALNNHANHVPYRNSKLTYLLQDCLGGDSKTLMFVNVSADEVDANESLSSLQFAQRVARVELKAAHRHTERTGEAKALAALQAKESEAKSLQAKVTNLERELKRKSESTSELESKMRRLESELQSTKRALNDRRKNDSAERVVSTKEMYEMKAFQEKAESQARIAEQRARTARELVLSKEEEIKRLNALLEARDHSTATENGIIPEFSKSSEDTDEDCSEPEVVEKVSRPVSAPAGSLMREGKTPIPRLPRSASAFPGRSRQVHFEENDMNSRILGNDSSAGVHRKAPPTPMPGPRRASSSTLPRGQTMHNSKFQRHSLARVPPSSSTAKRMSYGYGTRADAGSNRLESNSTGKPLRNARIPRARTTTSRPPQRVVQNGTRQPTSSTSSSARPPSAPPRRMGTVASGIDRVVSGKLPPKP